MVDKLDAFLQHPNKAFSVTSAIPTAGAAGVKGTIVDELLGHGALEKEFIRRGHPGGIIEVGTELKRQGDDYICSKAILGRRARRLMNGYDLVPRKCFIRRGGVYPRP